MKTEIETEINKYIQNWFSKFHAGDFSLDNIPLSDRPVEVDSSQLEY